MAFLSRPPGPAGCMESVLVMVVARRDNVAPMVTFTGEERGDPLWSAINVSACIHRFLVYGSSSCLGLAPYLHFRL